MQEPMLELKLGLYDFFGELGKYFDLAPWMEEESRIKDPHTLILKSRRKSMKEASNLKP